MLNCDDITHFQIRIQSANYVPRPTVTAFSQSSMADSPSNPVTSPTWPRHYCVAIHSVYLSCSSKVYTACTLRSAHGSSNITFLKESFYTRPKIFFQIAISNIPPSPSLLRGCTRGYVLFTWNVFHIEIVLLEKQTPPCLDFHNRHKSETGRRPHAI